jgi:hypothetical protein
MEIQNCIQNETPSLQQFFYLYYFYYNYYLYLEHTFSGKRIKDEERGKKKKTKNH